MAGESRDLQSYRTAYDRNIIKSALASNTKQNFSVEYSDFVSKVVKQLIIDPKNEWDPMVSGWYYVNMINGTWVDEVKEMTSTNEGSFKEFSTNATGIITEATEHFGHLIKDINPPQVGIDYDSISGRLRTINIATRSNLTNEFSITWKDNSEAIIFKYHELWNDYIEAQRKGFFKSTIDKNTDIKNDYFISVPYLNAVWIAIFKPHTYNLLGLIKLMGVAPTNPIPLQEILGQRGVPQAATYTINYKIVDAIIQMYHGEPYGNFYNEFMESQNKFFKSDPLTSLSLSKNTVGIKLFD